MIELRAARPDDAPVVADLHVKSWQSAYRGILPDSYLDGELAREKADHWRSMLAAPPDGACVLIGFDDARAIGFVAAYPEPPDGALIDNLHVLPDARRQGAGRMLMQRVAARLLEDGVREAWLTVYEANEPAIAFYRRMGGRYVGRGIAEHGGFEAPDLEFRFDLERLASGRWSGRPEILRR